MDRFTQDKERKEKSGSNGSLHRMKVETEVLREELNHGVLLVNRMHKERLRLGDAIEDEAGKQQSLKQKIASLRAEYFRLQKTLKSNQKLLNHKSNERVVLEKVVAAAQHTTDRVKASHAPVIKNNFAKLMNQINSGSSSLTKERSVLLNCYEILIRTMSENEFEEFNWVAKVAESTDKVAGRLRFSNIYITESDLRFIFKPVLNRLRSSFGRSEISVQAKSAKENGVVTCFDLIITVPARSKGLERELP